MNWYKNDRQKWKEVIQTVSSETKRSPILIEKDLVQSEFLFQLSRSVFPLVFKGGTSLSKAYGLINRFSEDIDLSSFRHVTEKEKKEIKMLITETGKRLNLRLINLEVVKSRHKYNKYEFEYESLFQNMIVEIIIETSFYQESYPTNVMPINNYVRAFCTNERISSPLSFEADIFDFNVQSLKRTFIDKVFAVCDYRLKIW